MDVHNSQPQSLLSTIPLEVLLHITSSLTTPEFGNLRRTCKRIESSITEVFTREFFTKRQFMITEFSLQALVDISTSRFGKHLKHVIIGLERPMRPHGGSSGNAEIINHMSLEHIQHQTLLNTGRDVEMLAEAFSNLKNLETIGMRDFYSRSRNRDYPNIQWKSYGVSTYERQASTSLGMFTHTWHSSDSGSYSTRTFLNLLRALGKAGATPKKYEVILRHNSLEDTAFYIPKYVEPSIGACLTNLRTLFLDLSPNFPTWEVDLDGRQTTCVNYYLLKFLSKVTHLEYLRLNFRAYPENVRNDVLSWLSRDASAVTPGKSTSESTLRLPKFPPSVDFAHLEQLDIGMILVHPDVLASIVKKYHATLRAISLHKVTLLEADSVTAKTRVNLWSKLFGQLAKLDIKLEFLCISWPSQSQTRRRHHRVVRFKKTSDPLVKTWAGTNIQSGLRDFVSDTVIERLDLDTDDESGDSDVPMYENGNDDDDQDSDED